LFLSSTVLPFSRPGRRRSFGASGGPRPSGAGSRPAWQRACSTRRRALRTWSGCPVAPN